MYRTYVLATRCPTTSTSHCALTSPLTRCSRLRAEHGINTFSSDLAASSLCADPDTFDDMSADEMAQLYRSVMTGPLDKHWLSGRYNMPEDQAYNAVVRFWVLCTATTCESCLTTFSADLWWSRPTEVAGETETAARPVWTEEQYLLAGWDCCKQGEGVVAVTIRCTGWNLQRSLWRSLCCWFRCVFHRQDWRRPCVYLHNAAIQRRPQCYIDDGQLGLRLRLTRSTNWSTRH